MMYVGDKGKATGRRIIPEAKMKAYKGPQPEPEPERVQQPQQQPGQPRPFSIGNLPPKFEEFIAACRGGSKDSSGSFQLAEHLSTMINLGIVALRAGTTVKFDPVNKENYQ